MKRFPKTEYLSIFSIILGIIGMSMESWLLSDMDNKGLLPYHHMGNTLAFILLAIVAGVCFCFLQNVKTAEDIAQMFPRSPLAAGSLFAAAGMGFCALSGDVADPLSLIVRILGLASALALGYLGICRIKGKRPPFLLYGLIALFLIFRTLTYCRSWSAETQISVFFFPLLANLFLLVTIYYRAALEASMKNCRQFLFFRQLALFCCLVSISGGDWLFYLAGALWAATDFCIPAFFGKYAA